MNMPPRPNMKNIIRRLGHYVFARHKIKWLLVLICITVSALSGVLSTVYIKTLINDHINPMLTTALAGGSPAYGGLISSIIYIALVCLAGVVATLLHNLLLVVISQKTLKNIRDEMFAKMQKLPIRYFDTHTHGDIMSRYTNDTDTLEQLISQTLPNFIS